MEERKLFRCQGTLASLLRSAADPNSEHKKTPSRDRIETIKCTEDAQEDPEAEGL